MAHAVPSKRRTREPAISLIVNGYVLTMDGNRTVYPDGAIAVSGKKIVAGRAEAHGRGGVAGDAQDRRAGRNDPSGLHRRPLSCRTASQPRLDHRQSQSTEGRGRRRTGRVHALDQRSLRTRTNTRAPWMAPAELVRNGFTGFVDAATSFCARSRRGSGGSGRHPLLRSPTACCGTILGDGEPMAAEIPRAPCSLDTVAEGNGRPARSATVDEDALVRGHIAIYGCGSATR